MSWLVYAVRSSVICRSCPITILRVPSLPLNSPSATSRSRCRMHAITVHMRRLGTLIDTGCESDVNLAA